MGCNQPGCGANADRGAVRHLNSGGELRIVANAFLPYPDVLDETFGFHEGLRKPGVSRCIAPL
ncbi:methyltransferase [Escherichia coli]|uniref:methyltransferase n=1 Tax=Escherichia coli TaxID=562 RepID=UPI0039A6E27B